MYRVLVVEDEQSALDHICTIIRLHCPSFLVIGTAANGQEALTIINARPPDLVIMDIRMPVMDGLELSRQLVLHYPAIYSIIISGYQDFEYAREALKNQVFDYLLKPISPSGLRKALDKVEQRIVQDFNHKKGALITAISCGKSPDPAELERIFPEKAYMAALVRNNGLSGRFSHPSPVTALTLGKEVMHTFGRDEQETLYLCPAHAISPDYFQTIIKGACVKAHSGYYTLILLPDAFSVQDMPRQIQCLYQTLNQCLIVGQNQVITASDIPETGVREVAQIVTAANLTEISHYLHKQDMESLKLHLTQLFSRWTTQGIPQLMMERAVKQLFYQIGIDSQAFRYDSKIDSMVEDAFSYAESADQLAESLTGISDHMLTGPSSVYYKINTKEFFQNIEKYIADAYEQPLSLHTVCQFFGISQTYISRLFRKYTGQSFNSYLTMVRIQQAKKLLEQNHEILIKDVASLVGYSNQFYFSRIFRSVTGVSPSEYVQGEDKNYC